MPLFRSWLAPAPSPCPPRAVSYSSRGAELLLVALPKCKLGSIFGPLCGGFCASLRVPGEKRKGGETGSGSEAEVSEI